LHAIAVVEVDSTIAIAVRVYGIPPSFLCDHIHGRTTQRKKGRQGVLTLEEETGLVKWMLNMQDRAHPVSILEFKSKVTEITQERWTPFKDGIPRHG